MPKNLIPTPPSGSLKSWPVSFNLKITIVTLLSIASGVIIFLHWKYPQVRDELVFAVGVIGGAAAIYLGFYTSRTLVVNVERQKQQNAFELLRDSYRVDTSAIIILIRTNFGADVSATDHCKKIEADKDLHKSILTVLGIFEDISIAVQADMACERILYLSLGFMVPWIYQNMKPFIEYRRERDKDPTIWLEIEKLATSWKKNESIMTGKRLE